MNALSLANCSIPVRREQKSLGNLVDIHQPSLGSYNATVPSFIVISPTKRTGWLGYGDQKRLEPVSWNCPTTTNLLRRAIGELVTAADQRVAKAARSDVQVSHETIYRFLNALHREHPLRQAMRRQGRRKRKEKPGFIKRPQENRRSIHERPKVVDKRGRVGDWEVDLMRCMGAAAI